MDGLTSTTDTSASWRTGTDHTSPSLLPSLLALSASRGIVPPNPQAWSKISLVAELASRFQQIRDQYGWVDHLGRAGVRYTERHGNDYGAAVTYFSVLSLVPVTMVAFAAAGFALGAQPQVVQRLKNEIAETWPERSATR